MYFQSYSAVHAGQETRPVRIEAGFTGGYSGIQILGNVSEVCKDGQERARAALEHLGWKLPPQKINVSFTPGDIRKHGNHFDLAFAVNCYGLISGYEPSVNLDKVLFAGELSLQGEVLPVANIVATTIEAMRNKFEFLVIPFANLREVKILEPILSYKSRITVVGVRYLREVLHWLDTGQRPEIYDSNLETISGIKSVNNFDDMSLTSDLKMLATVCASGRHSLLLRGSPGTGKTMFASRLASLLPQLKGKTHLEVLRHYSLDSTLLPDSLLHGLPPVRMPHHTCSAQALTGNGEHPGELALAHGGILFLDEINEFRRDILESLREPLESRKVAVSRANRKTVWKCHSLLIAACNNCPCGWSNSKIRRCTCATNKLQAYQQRLSGPLQQRLDIHFLMPESLGKEHFFEQNPQNGQTKKMREQIKAVEEYSRSRNLEWGAEYNAEIPGHAMVAAMGLTAAELKALLTGNLNYKTTQRSLIRMLRVSRTLADLEQSRAVKASHLRQAAAWLPESCESQLGIRRKI